MLEQLSINIQTSHLKREPYRISKPVSVTYVFTIGHLPIEIDMNDVQPGKITTFIVEENNQVLPPPLPPKMVELTVSDVEVPPARPPKMKELMEVNQDIMD